MKIEIEISDSDKELFEHEGVNLEKLVRGAAAACIDGLKQVFLAKKAGIPMDMSTITDYGRSLGINAMKNAKEAPTDGKV